MDNLNAERERKKKMATLNIVLKRASKTYKEGETIKGVVYVNSKGELSHNGLSLTALSSCTSARAVWADLKPSTIP